MTHVTLWLVYTGKLPGVKTWRASIGRPQTAVIGENGGCTFDRCRLYTSSLC